MWNIDPMVLITYLLFLMLLGPAAVGSFVTLRRQRRSDREYRRRQRYRLPAQDSYSESEFPRAA